MAKKTAIHVSWSDIRRREYAADCARDTEADNRPLSTSDVLASWRAARDALTPDELIRRATDAALLTLQGKQWSAEDRRDCAADVVWHVLAITDNVLPNHADERVTVQRLRGRAQNWRRAQMRQREADKRETAKRSTREAAAWSDAAEIANIYVTGEVDPDYDDVVSARESAAQAADVGCRKLGLPIGGVVWDALLWYCRGETMDVVADELDVNPNTFKNRVARGCAMLRAVCPNSLDLIETLTGLDTGRARDGAVIYAVPADKLAAEHRNREVGRVSPPPREGTCAHLTPREAGKPWTTDLHAERAEDAPSARQASDCRHQAPVPGLRDIGRAMARRGAWHSAIVAADGRKMYWTSQPIHIGTHPGGADPLTARGIDPRTRGLGGIRTDAQRQADARRTTARILAPVTREAGVDYVKPDPERVVGAATR